MPTHLLKLSAHKYEDRHENAPAAICVSDFQLIADVIASPAEVFITSLSSSGMKSSRMYKYAKVYEYMKREKREGQAYQIPTYRVRGNQVRFIDQDLREGDLRPNWKKATQEFGGFMHC